MEIIVDLVSVPILYSVFLGVFRGLTSCSVTYSKFSSFIEACGVAGEVVITFRESKSCSIEVLGLP